MAIVKAQFKDFTSMFERIRMHADEPRSMGDEEYSQRVHALQALWEGVPLDQEEIKEDLAQLIACFQTAWVLGSKISIVEAMVKSI